MSFLENGLWVKKSVVIVFITKGLLACQLFI
jgi:hypothetical protein